MRYQPPAQLRDDVPGYEASSWQGGRQLKVISPTVEPWICGDVLGPNSLAPSG
jgi:hypothetical protein